MLWGITIAMAEIVNGSIETEFPATVALGAQFGEQAFSACTGTLITPRIILSAAHCGGDLPPELVLQAGKAFFGPSVNEPNAVIGFSDLVMHPDYEELEGTIGGSLGANDFSLLVLSEEAPVSPIFFQQEALSDDWIGRDIMSVGFGITGANANDAGTKRSANLVISELQQMFVIVDNADNENNSNICSGDSGGSQMFFDQDIGEWVQIAVHSWGDQGCEMTSGSTRTDLVVDWIFETIENVHGSTDICEINGYYDDDECTEYSYCSGIDPACIEEEVKQACQAADSQALWFGLFSVIPLWWRRR